MSPSPHHLQRLRLNYCLVEKHFHLLSENLFYYISVFFVPLQCWQPWLEALCSGWVRPYFYLFHYSNDCCCCCCCCCWYVFSSVLKTLILNFSWCLRVEAAPYISVIKFPNLTHGYIQLTQFIVRIYLLVNIWAKRDTSLHSATVPRWASRGPHLCARGDLLKREITSTWLN